MHYRRRFLAALRSSVESRSRKMVSAFVSITVQSKSSTSSVPSVAAGTISKRNHAALWEPREKKRILDLELHSAVFAGNGGFSARAVVPCRWVPKKTMTRQVRSSPGRCNWILQTSPTGVLRVYKDGSNQGRRFFGCGQRDSRGWAARASLGEPEPESCSFFQWADALGPSQTAARLEWRCARPRLSPSLEKRRLRGMRARRSGAVGRGRNCRSAFPMC